MNIVQQVCLSRQQFLACQQPKSLIFFCVFFFSLVANQVQAQNCHLRELDLCAASLLVFTQGPSGKESANHGKRDAQLVFFL